MTSPQRHPLPAYDYKLLAIHQTPPDMKERPILDWLNELPPGYRERAILNHADHPNPYGHKVTCSLSQAINEGIWWEDTPENYKFWSQLRKSLRGDRNKGCPIPLPPLPDDGHGGPTLEPEETNNTMCDYSNTPVARPTLVYGEDVAGMNEARCMQVMKAINSEVEDLQKVSAIAESALVTQRIAERGAALNEVVRRLDSFATPAA